MRRSKSLVAFACINGFVLTASLSSCKKTKEDQKDAPSGDVKKEFDIGTATFDATGATKTQFILKLDTPAAMQPGTGLSLPVCGDPYSDDILVGYILCTNPPASANAQALRVDIFAKNTQQACYEGGFTTAADSVPKKKTEAKAPVAFAGCTEGRVYQAKLDKSFELLMK